MSHIVYSLYDDNDLVASFDSFSEAEEAQDKLDGENNYREGIFSLIDEISSETSDLTTNLTDLTHNDVCLLNIEGKIKEFREKWGR